MSPVDLVGAAFGTLAVPIQAEPAGGSTIGLTLTYDPAVLQATGATVTPITLGAAITVDLSIPGEARIWLARPQPFTGAGPLAMMQFQVMGAAGTTSPLNLTRADIDGGAVSTCGINGQATICTEVPAEIQGVMLSGKGVSTITWTPDPASVSYDVTENLITRLRSDRSAVNAACLSHGSLAASAIDTHATPVDDGFYYIVRAVSACGKGSFGNGSYGELRTPINVLACP